MDRISLENRETCPACSKEVTGGFALGDYEALECRACGYAWIPGDFGGDHLASVYGEDYFTGGEAGYDDYAAGGGLLRKRGERYGRLLAEFCEPGKLVDVGAAAGFLMDGFADVGWEVCGVEPNDEMAALGRSRGLNLDTGSLEDFEGDPASFDAVSMVQVVAHFWDVDAAFHRATELLRPGGILLVETWDRRSLTARAFGKRWHEYSPPSTLRWFTRQSLAEMLGKRGFTELKSRKTVKSISFGHARSLASAKWKSARVVLKTAGWVPKGVPIPYLADDLFWAVFRKD